MKPRHGSSGISVVGCCIIVICLLAAGAFAASSESTIFLYERTGYLEPVCQSGSLWANPGLLGEVKQPVFLAENVTPLGNRYVVASSRFSAPISPHWKAALGILGSGPYITGSSQATGDQGGFTASGSFFFTQPNVHVAVAYVNELLGSLGLLAATGWETDDYANDLHYFGFQAMAGWISPYFLGHVGLSWAQVFSFHQAARIPWDSDGKAGVRVRFLDERLLGSFEATFSFTDRAVALVSGSQGTYHMAKALVSLRAYGVLAGIAGFSSDLQRLTIHTIGDEADNGNCVHLGVEVRQTPVYPFFGGYEMGISTTWFPRMIHRFWVGYAWGKKNADLGLRNAD